MQNWKKQEQKRIEQNKKDLENLKREIDYRISSSQNNRVSEDSKFSHINYDSSKERRFVRGYRKYRGATKEQYKKIKESTEEDEFDGELNKLWS